MKNKKLIIGVVAVLLLLATVAVFALQSGNATSNIVASSDIILKIKVQIPCQGHAPLIINSLKMGGVENVDFSLPNIFTIKYDSSKITKQQILSQDIFKQYSALEI